MVKTTFGPLGPMNLGPISRALKILPPAMDSMRARLMLLAIGMQESKFLFRHQVLGPAVSYWQFEEGGGVKGVVRHQATAALCRELCTSQGVGFDTHAIYVAMETNDVLGAGMARLLLFSDPKPLPLVLDAEGSWAYYLRCWRPGKPHPGTWLECHNAARAALGV